MFISRRAVLEGLGAAAFIPFQGTRSVPGAETPLRVAGNAVEIAVTPIGPRIIRISIVPLDEGRPRLIPDDGSLAPQDRRRASARLEKSFAIANIIEREWRVAVTREPLSFRVESR